MARRRANPDDPFYPSRLRTKGVKQGNIQKSAAVAKKKNEKAAKKVKSRTRWTAK